MHLAKFQTRVHATIEFAGRHSPSLNQPLVLSQPLQHFHATRWDEPTTKRGRHGRIRGSGVASESLSHMTVKGNKARKVNGGNRRRDEHFAMDVFGAINLNPYAFSGESPSWWVEDGCKEISIHYIILQGKAQL